MCVRASEDLLFLLRALELLPATIRPGAPSSIIESQFYMITAVMRDSSRHYSRVVCMVVCALYRDYSICALWSRERRGYSTRSLRSRDYSQKETPQIAHSPEWRLGVSENLLWCAPFHGRVDLYSTAATLDQKWQPALTGTQPALWTKVVKSCNGWLPYRGSRL